MELVSLYIYCSKKLALYLWVHVYDITGILLSYNNWEQDTARLVISWLWALLARTVVIGIIYLPRMWLAIDGIIGICLLGDKRRELSYRSMPFKWLQMPFGKLRCRICNWNQTGARGNGKAYKFMSYTTWSLQFEFQATKFENSLISHYRLFVENVNHHDCAVQVLLLLLLLLLLLIY